MGFGFLGANGGNDAAVGDGVIGRDLVAENAEDGFGAVGHARTDTTGKADQFVGKAVNPRGFVEAMRELAVFKGLPGERIEYGVCDMLARSGR
jgi:hypothetical protein